MRIKDIEQMFATMTGDRLLEELVVFAAIYLDQVHNDDEDHMEAIIRAIQTRLAETGIARKYHKEACRFMLGEDRCPCSIASWSWHRKGLPEDRG
jgi:hypothetical protein